VNAMGRETDDRSEFLDIQGLIEMALDMDQHPHHPGFVVGACRLPFRAFHVHRDKPNGRARLDQACGFAESHQPA